MLVMVFIAYFLEIVLKESKTSLNVDIHILFKTLILKIKYIFHFKNLQHFLHQKFKSSKFQQGLTNMNLFMNT
jgi:hypothetical protein